MILRLNIVFFGIQKKEMKPTLCFLIFCLLSACNYFENKKVYSEDLLQEELQTFNWTEVDTYPTFSNCDSILDKNQQKVCFENLLVRHVSRYLSQQNIKVTEDINDTIRLKIEINKQGKLFVKAIDLNPETTFQIPKIDSLLRQSLHQVPKIFPAIKRGQQVTTVFELPVIVKIN